MPVAVQKNAYTRLIIIDDHDLFREALSGMFQQQADFEVIGEAGTVSEAIRLAHEVHPDLILMDYRLPDGTGLEATKAILAEQPMVKIVFLTVFETDEELFAAIEAGAAGYLLKKISVKGILNSLRGVMRGEAPISREMTRRILEEFRRRPPELATPTPASILTGRELQILFELTDRVSNQEIADRLYISISTVKNHIHHMLKKLELRNRRELVDFAKQQGLIKKINPSIF